MRHDQILYDFIRIHGLVHTHEYYGGTAFFALYLPGGWFSRKKKIIRIAYDYIDGNKRLSKNQKPFITIFAYDTDIKDLIQELDKSLTEGNYEVSFILSGPKTL